MAGVRAKASTAAPGSVYGIGVDILRVERMEKLLERHGQKLLNRLLCAKELREVRARKNRARALALCWPATPAFVKALGTGLDRQSADEGKGVSVRVNRGGRRIIKKKTT